LVIKFFKTIVRFLLIITLSLFLLIGVLQNFQVQSLLANITSTVLSEKFGAKVWIDKVYISSFFNIQLQNVRIFDHHDQPMITAKTIIGDINIFKPYLHEIPVNSVIIDSAFVRLKQYDGDDELNISKLFSNDADVTQQEVDSLIDQSNESVNKSDFQLAVDYVHIKNTRFILQSQDSLENEGLGMNYQNLDVRNINIEAEDIHIFNDSINGHVLNITAKEKCGFNLESIEAYANVGPRHLILKGTKLKTSKSYANMDLDFHYHSWSAYLDYINDVYMNIDISSSKINMEDIAFYASALSGMDNNIKIKGKVKGPVKNLNGKGLSLQYKKATHFRGDIQMRGLPDIYETFLNVKVEAFSTTLPEVQSFKFAGGKTVEELPVIVQKLGMVRLSGRFTGFYNDFATESVLISNFGLLKTDAQITNNTQDGFIHYKGDFKAQDLDLGLITGMESEFGNVDFDLNVKGKGLTTQTVDSRVIGQINNMNFKGNYLNTIYVDAFVRESEFVGLLDIDDEMIHSNFIGKIRFDSVNPDFDFKLNLADVKLAKLGLIPVDSSANFSTRIHMNFRGSRVDSLVGSIAIDGTKLDYIGNNYSIDSLHIKAYKPDAEKSYQVLKINSDFLNGEISGIYKYSQMAATVEALLQSYIGRIEFIDDDRTELAKEDLDFRFKISNTQQLTALFFPSIEMADSLVFEGGWNTYDSTLNLNVFSNRIVWDGIRYENPSLIIDAEESLFANLGIHEIVFKEDKTDESLNFGIDSLRINLEAANDILDYSILWKNYNRDRVNRGNINASLDFTDDSKISLKFEPSNMVINDLSWDIASGGRFTVDSLGYNFDSISFYSTEQDILIHGNISTDPNEDLRISFNKFNISTFDLLSGMYGINPDGFLDGEIQLIDLMNNPNFLADLHIKGFHINGEELGELSLKSTLNSDQSVFVNINVEKNGNKGLYKPLYLEGLYFPKRQTDQIDLDLSLHNFSLKFLDPFLKAFVANLEGNATGDVLIKGMLAKPNISGELDLARTQFRIRYLNTLYSLSGKLLINNSLIGFDDVTIYDTVGNAAVLHGGLTHQNLRGFGVDLNVKPENFVALNTAKGMNKQFYGKAVVTGELDIKGPFDNIFLNINASSKSGTDIVIPISTTLDVSDNDFIVFTEVIDSTKEEEEIYVPELSSFSLNMDLAVTPDARVEIELPEQMGKINAQGSGNLNMNLSRTGNFSMSGDYKVSKGLFFFQIRNLLNRKFTLNEGGSISWSGDPYNGILGMSANYQVKTSLSSLGYEQDSSYRSRVPVDCIIGLTGPIMNPNIKFNFSFPNATEEVKQFVYSKIDTTNASEMSQQMLSLLVLNSFSLNTSSSSLPTSISGSSFQILANQLSNWLSQISKDVDIGINYRPGTDMSNEEVEVELSTQLFDERVTVDGNFGYQNVKDNPANTSSSIVGDINVEVKITKDGRLRLKAFNRTNTVDLMDNTSPYTQGVGIFYRKEFNSIKDLFKSKKRKEKEKEEILRTMDLKAKKDEDIEETGEI